MGTEFLHSLTGLLGSVRDSESQRLAGDAIAAYHGGAFRAAILSIWVAVCADIISKLKELATGGDAAAKDQIEKLQKGIATSDTRQLLQFEGSLISVARDIFQMLLPHEAEDLERLKQDRHLCAHPAIVSEDAFFTPTPEIVRAHITHAILHLLSRDPVQGKQLIARFERDLLGGSFPRKREEIEVVLRNNYVHSAKEGSKVGLMKGLARSLTGEEAARWKGKEGQIAEALAQLGKIAPGLYETHIPLIFLSLGRDLGDDKILILCRYVEAESRVWDWLQAAGRARILAKIDVAPVKQLVEAGAHKARHVLDVGQRLLARFLEDENEGQLENLFKQAPCKAFVTEVLKRYGQSGSFATAEKRGRDCVIPHAPFMDSEDIRQLSEVIQRNPRGQILHASQSSTILLELFQKTQRTLPTCKAHWEELGRYIAESNEATSYEYPQFLSALREAGLEIPEVPADADTEGEDDIPF